MGVRHRGRAPGILSPLLPWDYSEPVTHLTQLSNTLFPEFIEALITETGIDPEYQASGMLVLPELLPEHPRDWQCPAGRSLPYGGRLVPTSCVSLETEFALAKLPLH